MVTYDSGWVNDESSTGSGMTRKVVVFDRREITIDVSRTGKWVIFEGPVGIARRTWGETGKAPDAKSARNHTEERVSWRIEMIQTITYDRDGYYAREGVEDGV
jgi:hypothetical protein